MSEEAKAEVEMLFGLVQDSLTKGSSLPKNPIEVAGFLREKGYDGRVEIGIRAWALMEKAHRTELFRMGYHPCLINGPTENYD